MKREFDFDRDDYTGNAVIERGYAIYDEWVDKSVSSRKIVAQAERAVYAVEQSGTKAAAAYALACLFALDTRIKEKYNTFWRCLFSYFSWRRETRAYKLLKDTFRMPDDESDIRTAIEVELKRLRERIDAQDADEDDDETRGGKRNGKSQDQASNEPEKQQDQISDNADEKVSDANEVQEEPSEEKTEEISNKAPRENQITEVEEMLEGVEVKQEEAVIPTLEEREPSSDQLPDEFKEEINLSEKLSEHSIDKTDTKKVNNTTNEAFPLYDIEVENKDDGEPSFIDEVIMDNMVKGEQDYVRHNPLDDVRQSSSADHAVQADAMGDGQMDNAEKDAYLYDSMVLGDNDAGAQQQTLSQNSAEIKSQEQMQSNSNLEAVKQDFENFRMPIAVDISNDLENQMRIDITNSLSDEAKMEMVRLQIEAAREQIAVESADFDFNAPVDNAGVQEPPSIDVPVSQQYRK